MPEWQQRCGKTFPTLLPDKEGEFVEFAPVGWWKPALVGLEEGEPFCGSCALCSVLAALNSTFSIRNTPLPATGAFGRCLGQHVKAGKIPGERAAVGTRMDVPVLPCRPGFSFFTLMDYICLKKQLWWSLHGPFQNERVVLVFPESDLSISILPSLSHLQPRSTGGFGLSQ